jgi:hypothetical protein
VSRATAIRGVGGIACLALATLAVLLARDVWRVEGALRSGDVRSQVTAVPAGAWAADTILPFDLARRLLGVRDDLAFRSTEALARTMTGTPANDTEVQRRLPVKEALIVGQGDSNGVRASVAANLLGIIYSTDPSDPSKPSAVKALDQFVLAVELDPNDETAKTNLELFLRQASGDQLRGRKGASAGQVPGHSGAGRRAGGNGY